MAVAHNSHIIPLGSLPQSVFFLLNLEVFTRSWDSWLAYGLTKLGFDVRLDNWQTDRVLRQSLFCSCALGTVYVTSRGYLIPLPAASKMLNRLWRKKVQLNSILSSSERWSSRKLETQYKNMPLRTFRYPIPLPTV